MSMVWFYGFHLLCLNGAVPDVHILILTQPQIATISTAIFMYK